MIYIYNILSIVFVGIFSKRFGKQSNKIFCTFCLLQMTFIVGLRYQVGADWYSYENVYEYIAKSDLVKNFSKFSIEIGYVVLNKLLYVFDIPYWGLNVVIAFFTFYFFLKAIQLISPHVVLSVYLYVSFFLFYQAMNQTRQILAISIGLYALACLFKNDTKRFVMFIGIAAIFHTSVILLLVFLLLKKIKISRKVLVIYCISPILCIACYEILLQIISHTKYALYINSIYDQQGLSSTIVNFGVRSIMLILALIFMRRLNVTEENNCLYHMILICTVLQALTTYSSLFGRVTTVFFVAYLILIPKLIDTIHVRKNRALTYLLCVLCATVYHYVYYVFAGSSVGVTVYNNYLLM